MLLDAFLTDRFRMLACLHDIRGSDQSKKLINREVQGHLSNINDSESSGSLRASRSFNGIICLNQRHKIMKRHHLCINSIRSGHKVIKCDYNHRC